MKYVFSSLVALGLVASALGLTTAQAETSNASNSWPSGAKLVCWAEMGVTEVTPKLLVGGGLRLLESHHWISPDTAHSWEARWDKAELGRHWAELVRRLLHGDHSSATASCEWL
jgi:hypothetical protein